MKERKSESSQSQLSLPRKYSTNCEENASNKTCHVAQRTGLEKKRVTCYMCERWAA